jgi:predicted ATPase
MFTRIQTRAYRCLKQIDERLGPFRALVGPNASGKTTFLDVIGFLGDLMRNRGDVVRTVQSRSENFEKLLWLGAGNSFQLAVEAEIPLPVHERMAEDNRRFTLIRYEIQVGLDPASNEIGVDHETLWLAERDKTPGKTPSVLQRSLFPSPPADMHSILSRSSSRRKITLTKNPKGNDNYYSEHRGSYAISFNLGRGHSALANIPAIPESFPVSTWFRSLLEKGVQTFVLNSDGIRRPSPPGLGRRFQTDGSNLPWVISELKKDTKRFQSWLSHVRTALEDIRDISTVERPEDRHCYIIIEYANGAKVPSWLVSDGTLRLLALTIPAYLRDLHGTFLIEEPENGIHPRAIETVLQSLTSMYDCQVLVATHSPVALNMLEPRDVLCFAKDESGAADIVSGDKHPALADWKRGEPDLGLLFAAGILS